MNSCDERTFLKMKANEYVLTRDDPNAKTTLCDRIKGIPIAPAINKSVFGTISKDRMKEHFIIHLASRVQRGEPGINGLTFCVSFLRKNAETLQQARVSGKAMNQMVTHTLVKKSLSTTRQ